MIRFELTRFAAPPPQDGESTNFSTWPKQKKVKLLLNFQSDLAGIRTQDPIIKSDVLYQLSYQVFQSFPDCGCKYTILNLFYNYKF